MIGSNSKVLLTGAPPNWMVEKAARCDYGGCTAPATTESSDRFGNILLVCDEHAEALANQTNEREGDRWYDDHYKD